MVTAACFNDWNGLVAGNGYIVKDITIINKKLSFVKVKNVFKPLGSENDKIRWKGKYNLNDERWTDELKLKVNFAKLQPEEFFMTLDDFKNGFKSYTITHMRKDWTSSFIEKRGSVSKRLYKFNFQIGDDASPESLASLSDKEISLIENNDV